MKYTVGIASDHAGYDLKCEIVKHLQARDIQCIDLGANNSKDSVDYPDYAHALSNAILDKKKCQLGILVCGTGIGMSIAANRHKGIRCALCGDTYSARLTREHNDANVLALGSRVLGTGLAIDIVDSFLDNQYSNQDRHNKRVQKIDSQPSQP